jgi:hypothetical protein
MKMMILFFLQLVLVLAVVLVHAEEAAEVQHVDGDEPVVEAPGPIDDGFTGEAHICEGAEVEYLGTYTKTNAQQDGAPVYNNANDKSFFRSRGFWYLGDLQ